MTKASSAMPLTLKSVATPEIGQPYTLSSLERALREQSDLSAVERFSQFHDETSHNAQEQHYKSLIPLTKPASGQQYAFHVNLDSCTGCKACVTACHSLNGLDDTETWRSVGFLHGGTAIAPLQQTVTTACHHCLDPACMNGCPVGAYEKDPLTGIVKHLDDQCIGCQYCMLTCPYEVPQFNKRLGIVRKCDMCSDRLAVGEAPACVQACPNEAISIQIVEQRAVLEDAQTDAFLPGAPSPGITAPTTTYTSSKPLPRNMLPADFYAVRPAHQHMPLVVMLVLTQLSVGAFCVDQILSPLLPPSLLAALRPWQSASALGFGLLALFAANFHLGRPQFAFRAFMGVRTSWMSREIIVLGAFAGSATLYAGAVWQADHAALHPSLAFLPALAREMAPALGRTVAVTGVLGVFCSVMLYVVTQRRWWSFSLTAFKFFLTAAVLGLSATIVIACAESIVRDGSLSGDMAAWIVNLAAALGIVTALKLIGEASIFLHLSDKQQGDLKRSALLLKGELGTQTMMRFTAGALGGLVVPFVFLSSANAQTGSSAVVGAALSLVLLTAGELVERMTFFSALSHPRMPGGIG